MICNQNILLFPRWMCSRYYQLFSFCSNLYLRCLLPPHVVVQNTFLLLRYWKRPQVYWGNNKLDAIAMDIDIKEILLKENFDIWLFFSRDVEFLEANRFLNTRLNSKLWEFHFIFTQEVIFEHYLAIHCTMLYLLNK